MDSGFRRNDESGRLSSKRKEKRQELDPGLRRMTKCEVFAGTTKSAAFSR
jgi:hypothetical protein